MVFDYMWIAPLHRMTRLEGLLTIFLAWFSVKNLFLLVHLDVHCASLTTRLTSIFVAVDLP